MQRYGTLADVIVTVHAGIVAFVVVGLLLTVLGLWLRWQWVRNFWFRSVHLATISIVAFEALCGYECPLTTWERDLRVAAGQEVSEASFVGRLMHELLFYDAPESIFRVGHCVFGVLVLAVFLLAPPRRPGRRQAAVETVKAAPSEGIPTNGHALCPHATSFPTTSERRAS